MAVAAVKWGIMLNGVTTVVAFPREAGEIQ